MATVLENGEAAWARPAAERQQPHTFALDKTDSVPGMASGWPKSLDLCPCAHVQSLRSSELLASHRLSPSHCGHSWSEPADEGGSAPAPPLSCQESSWSWAQRRHAHLTSFTFCKVSGVMVKSTGLGVSFPF